MKTMPLELYVIRRIHMYPKYSKIPNVQFNHYLILGLILNGLYSESVTLAQSTFSNHIIVFFTQ